MKFYLSHSSGYDYQTELYEPLKSTLAQEHEIFFPHDEHEDGIKSKDIIASSDAVIAEVSFPSTGQGIELGWADSQEKPILCFYRTDSNISSAVRFISNNLIEYESVNDMLQKLQQIIETGL
jgi:nucleoside 2-deoxyribosyltransferase